VKYLCQHFRSDVGLIYESEDSGTHWLKRTEYPSWNWTYSQTFWLYSDNLFAAAALEPFAPEISSKINATLGKYPVPTSGKFEAVLGQPVGPDRGAQDVILFQNSERVVLIRIHNGSIGDPRFKYADAMIYDALTKYYLGQREQAQRIVREVHDLWNGTCILDDGFKQRELTPGNAPSDVGYGLNFKLALLLYACKVTETNFTDYSQMEEYLWSMQIENGGIASLCQDGKPLGSANCETTALTLLIYNDALISRLQNRLAVPEVHSLILVAVLVVTPSLALTIKKKRI